MIRVLICCAGGFSSSAMMSKVAKEIVEKQLQDEITIDFEPFSRSYHRIDEADILMVCPHQKYKVKEFVDQYVQDKIPVYLIPPRIYGSMPVEEVLQDAKDIINEFHKTKMNPFHFPGEDNIMRVKRVTAYRNSKAD